MVTVPNRPFILIDVIHLYKAIMCTCLNICQFVPRIWRRGLKSASEPYHAVENDEKRIYVVLEKKKRNTPRSTSIARYYHYKQGESIKLYLTK